ncbi:hypothetical protein A6U86_27655 [Rhizobium sp. AC27/96]|nr:hypothetical protein A6U86_27655 [Rhizobium sp. AC27/96]
MIVCGFDRHVRSGHFSEQEGDLLNHFYPDVVRSVFVSARLRLQQYQSMVDVMEALGAPCVAIGGRRRIQTMNKQFETRFGNLFSGAWNQLNLGSANEHLEAILSKVEADQDYAPGSFGLRDRQDAPIVLHCFPIRRAAHDIFTSASCFVFITEMNGNGIGPEPELLKALFGLTNKEAQLSSELTAGYSLQQAAANLDITFGTARAYLLRIFQKTGTAQQSQLVGLLSRTSPAFVKPTSMGDY